MSDVPSWNIVGDWFDQIPSEMEAEIEDFVEGFKQPAYRGMRVDGQRVSVWLNQCDWSGA